MIFLFAFFVFFERFTRKVRKKNTETSESARREQSFLLGRANCLHFGFREQRKEPEVRPSDSRESTARIDNGKAIEILHQPAMIHAGRDVRILGSL
jgi:hypothetical protein